MSFTIIMLKINMIKAQFTDTDSFMHGIKTEDVYEDFNKNKETYDFSNYSPKSKRKKKLVVGKVKNETSGVAVKEFVEQKPKRYSFLVDNSSDHKKAKGVNRKLLLLLQ